MKIALAVPLLKADDKSLFTYYGTFLVLPIAFLSPLRESSTFAYLII